MMKHGNPIRSRLHLTVRTFGISSHQSEVSLSLEGLIIGNIGLALASCFRFEVHHSMRRLRSHAKKLGQNKGECTTSFPYLSYRVLTVVRPPKRPIAGQFGLRHADLSEITFVLWSEKRPCITVQMPY